MGGYSSIDLDDDDDPHISYLNFSSNNFKYAKKSGSSWDTTTVTKSGEAGTFTSLAMDKDDVPRIAYLDVKGAIAEAYLKAAVGARVISTIIVM